MRQLLFLFFTLITFASIHAQDVIIYPADGNRDSKIWKRPVTKVLDYSHLMVDYNYTVKFKNESRHTAIFLQVGDHVSRCSNGYSCCRDSFYYALKEARYSPKFSDEAEAKFPYSWDYTMSSWKIYKNSPKKGEYFILDSSSPGEKWEVSPKPIPEIKWQLMSEKQKLIGGHPCLSAKAEFWGRTWTVWYAPDIPISLGPWMLGGLPGLILYASDKEGEHIFELRAIENKRLPIIFTEWDYFKTKRYEQVIQQKLHYCKEPFKNFKARGLLGEDVEPGPNELFYNPLPLFKE